MGLCGAHLAAHVGHGGAPHVAPEQAPQREPPPRPPRPRRPVAPRLAAAVAVAAADQRSDPAAGAPLPTDFCLAAAAALAFASAFAVAHERQRALELGRGLLGAERRATQAPRVAALQELGHGVRVAGAARDELGLVQHHPPPDTHRATVWAQPLLPPPFLFAVFVGHFRRFSQRRAFCHSVWIPRDVAVHPKPTRTTRRGAAASGARCRAPSDQRPESRKL